MSEETKTNQITLTAEQLVNIVGHAATQEQLDNVRRELDVKIDKSHSELNNRIDISIRELRNEMKSDIGKLDSKIDTNLKWMIGMWLTTLVSIALAVMKLMPH